MIVINYFVLFFVIFFYTFSLIGAGILLNNYLSKDQKYHVGLLGLYGFIVIFLISVLLHFFLPLKLEITFPILIFFLIIFIKNYKKIEDINILLLLMPLALLASSTIKFHDDFYWYHLPTINYVQNFKIIFGISNINHYIYGHALYDIMSMFKFPYIENKIIKNIPIIFLMFSFVYLKNLFNKDDSLKLLIIFLASVILLRYTRSKEYGADIVSQLLIILIFVNCYLHLKTSQNKYFKNILIFFLFGIFNKQYVIFSIPFVLLSFHNAIKNFDIKNYKKIIIFLSLLLTLSLGKNVIQTGCFFYPIKYSCPNFNFISWSAGSKFHAISAQKLQADAKGYKAYLRNIEEKKIVKQLNHEEYLNANKIKYLYFITKDNDFKKFLTLLLILFITFLFSSNLRFNKKNDFNKKLFFSSLISFLILVYYSPQTRYGGNAFAIIFIFSLLNYFFNFKINLKKFFFILSLYLFFFIGKNFNRIKNEYHYLGIYKKNYPIIDLKIIPYSTTNKNNVKINISSNKLFCYNIKMLCTTSNTFDSIKKIKNISNYYIIIPDKQKNILSYKKDILYINKNWK